MADKPFEIELEDIGTNPTNNPTIHDVIAEGLSRRQTMMSGFAAAAATFLPAFTLIGCDEDDKTTPTDLVISAPATVATSSGRVTTLASSITSGVPTAYTWTQVSGPTVTLNGATTATASFTAPAVTTATPLVFNLVVSSATVAKQAAVTVTVNPAALGFTAVAKNFNDIVTVPAGYTVTVLYRLGDPIATGVSAYANDGTDSNFAQRAGDHHDGMYFFGLAASGNAPDVTSNTRGLLCINHENISVRYLHPNGQTTVAGARPTAEVVKEIEAHGVSVIEVSRAGASGAWSYVQTSTLNRRITPFTPMDINGPLRGTSYMKTAFSPTGVGARGTINNCANGFTPWGTYLTCEENWSGYFARGATDWALRSTKEQTSLTRYGRGGAGGNAGNQNWTTAAPIAAGDTRISKFNITINPTAPADGTGDFRNEMNQYGWVVEIDPFDGTVAPRKRTALARFAHEGAWPGRFVAGVKPAWYMGDDSAGDYIYKFVSSQAWATADANSANRLATGDKYLDTGTVYVAKFNPDFTGQWLPLVFGTAPLTAANAAYPFADQADVLLNARLAGDALGATRMDRPEWTAVNPKNGEMYCTLTQGPSRTGVQGTGAVPSTLATDPANPRVYVDPPSATRSNRNGHIIRIRENGDTTEALAFTWDLYMLAAGADLDATNINISGLDATNDLSNPDGLWFSRTSNAGGTAANPLLWIQTDDSGVFLDQTNCMMLVGQPGAVGDGTTKTITNQVSIGGTLTPQTQATKIGALPGTNLRRFLVGPKECEITGIDSTPDGRTVFINIQHPGEDTTAGFPNTFPSNWPASQTSTTAVSRPRSSTIVITKDDGGVVAV